MVGVGNVWGATGTFTKVTNASDLAAGDIVVLCCSTSTKAAGIFDGKKYFSSVDATISGTSLTSADAVEITLGKNGNNWTLTTTEGTIGATDAKALSTSNGTTTWTISISNGNASITSTTSSYGTIMYNSSAPRFLNYASGQTAIQIYKKVSAQTTVTLTAGANGSVKAYSDAARHTELKVDANNQFKVNQSTTVYFTATPSSSDYVVDKWTGATADDQDKTKASLAVGTDATKTVYVSFATASKHTVTWSVNGATTSEQVAEGSAITFKAPTSGIPTGKTFTGWTASPISGTQQSAPTYVTSATMGQDDVTYYAVFATASVGTDYTQITAENALEAGGRYLIVGCASSTYKALPVDKATSLTTVTPASSKISSPDAELVWTLEGSADKWKIKSVSNNKYLQIDNSSLTFENSTSLTFSVDVSSSVFKFTSSATSGSKVLSYYSSQSKFNAYSSANTVYVYKASVDYSDYCTTAAASHSVTLNTNGGTIADGKNVTSYSEGTAKNLPTASDITKTGNTFQGWFDNSSCEGTAITQIPSTATTDVEYWAKWQVNSYTLTWILNGGTIKTEGTAAGSVQYGATLTAPILEKTGHNYSWDPEVPSTMPADDATYEAIWTAQQYNISYQDQGGADFSGTHGANYPTTHTYGTATTLVSPTKTHYTFSGWYGNSECSGDALTSIPAEGYTADFTLYAKWTADPKYAATFYVNGEVYGTAVEYFAGESVVFPTNPSAPSSCSDKHFTGWTNEANKDYKSETTAPAYVTSHTMVAAAVNFYAVFADASGESNDYVKGSMNDLQTGKKVLILSNENSGEALSSEQGSYSGYLKIESVTINNGTISNPKETIIWNVTKTNDKYSFDQGTSKILNMTNDGNLYASGSSDTWSIALYQSTTSYQMTSTTGGKYFDRYNASGFKGYSYSGTSNKVDFYIQSVAYTNFATKCKACENAITITKGTESNGTFELSKTGVVCLDDVQGGYSVTVTATPNEYYHFASVSTTSGTPGTISDNQCVVSGITANTTITAVMEEDAKVTAKLHVGATVTEVENVYEGTLFSTIKPATDPTIAQFGDCATKFMGWATESIDGQTDEAGFNEIKVTDATTVTSSQKDFYAVFASPQGTGTPGSVEFNLTSIPSLSSGASQRIQTTNGIAFTFSSVSDANVSGTHYVQMQRSSTLTQDKTFPGNITSITFTGFAYSSTSNASMTITGCSTTGGTFGNVASLDGSYKGTEIDFSGKDYQCFKIEVGSSRAVKFTKMTVHYMDVSYGNYVTKCCNPLAAPENGSATTVGKTTATIGWSTVANNNGYQYQINDGDWVDVAKDATSADLTNLTAGTQYTITMRTKGTGDNCEIGTATSSFNFTTKNTVTAIADAEKGTALLSVDNTNWSTSVDALAGTTVYMKAESNDVTKFVFVSWSLGDQQIGTITDDHAATTTLTDWSGDVTLTAIFGGAALPELAKPTGMKTSTIGAIAATISWNAVANASGYSVVCDGATIGEITVVEDVCSCTLSGLTPNTQYTWTVKAKGDGLSYQDGPACDAQQFTTLKKLPTKIEITTPPTTLVYPVGGSFSKEGMVVKATYNTDEVTTNVADDCTFSPATFENAGQNIEVTISYSMNETTVSTKQNVTVRVQHTVQFQNNGTTIDDGTRYVYDGDEVGTLPVLTTGSCDPDGSNTFIGWSIESIDEKQPSAPSLISASTTIDEDKVYNAVWAKKVGSDNFTLVSSAANMAEGKAYIGSYINYSGAGYYIATGASSLAGKATVSNNVLTTTASMKMYDIVATGTANQYYIKDGNKYLHASTTKANPTLSDTECAWNFNGTSSLMNLTSSLNSNVYLRAYATSASAAVFKTYGDQTNTGICVFLQTLSYEDYITHCCTPLAAPTNAKASNVKSTTATISWDAVTTPAAASDYEYSLDGETWNEVPKVEEQVVTYVNLTGLTAALEYTAQVRATYSGEGNYCAKGNVSNINFTTLAISETPTFNPGTMTFVLPKSIEISAAAGASIYYTTNGDEPTTSSTKYTAAIEVSATTTIKAIAVEEGKDVSAVAEATYTKSDVKLDPQLAFSAAPESTVWGTDVTFTAASTLSAGAVTYSIKEENTGASISAEGVLTTTKACSLTVVATIAEAGDYNAQSIESAITVNKKTPVVSFDKSAYTGYVGVDFTSPTASVTEGYDGALAYTSNATSVAEVVEETGVVSIHTKGSAEITATAPATANWESANKKYTLTVYKPATEITLSAAKINLAVGASQTITATLTPEDADQEAIVWSSDNTAIATVNASGQVTAVAAGKTNITAKSKVDESVSATCIVKVAAAPTYTKVTQESDLAVGDIIVLADIAMATPYVASSISNGSFGYVEGSLSSNTLTVSGANELTLGKDNYDYWTLTSTQGSIGYDYSNAGTVVASTSNDYDYSWDFNTYYSTFTIGNYPVGMTYQSGYNVYYIKCNTSSHKFTTYLKGSESGTHTVNIYKKNVASYDITLTQPSEHAVIAASASSAKEGAEITLSTSSIDDGYEITAWSVVDEDGMPVTVTNGKFNMPASPVTVSATVSAIGYDVVVMGTNPADKATVTVNGEAELENMHVGDEITVAYSNLDEDYDFTSWAVEDEDENPITVTEGKFTMPASDVSVTLNVTEKTYTVSAATGIEHGSVSWTGTTDNKAPRGATITLSNEPAKGYTLKSYSVYKTGESTKTVEVLEGMFEMPNYDVTVSATFDKLPCVVLATPSVSAETTYRTVTLNWPAVANADYYEVYVMDGTTEKYGEQITETSVTVAKLAASKEYTYEVQAYANDEVAYCSSEVATASFTTKENPVPAVPVIEPNGGTDLTSAQTVHLSATDEVLTLDGIYYTTDGSDPNDGEEFTEDFVVNKNLTVKAIAMYSDADDNVFISEISSAAFSFIFPDAPTASIEEGQCYVGDQLTISGAEGCTLRYCIKIGEGEWGTVQESTTSATYTFAAEGTYKVQAQLQLNGLASEYWVKTYTAVAKPATVTLSINGNTDTKLTETTAGAGVTLPATEPNPCTNGDVWAFVGWSATSVGATTDAPELLDAHYTPAADGETVYAVYKKITGGTMHIEEDFSNMTSSTAVWSGDKYFASTNITAVYPDTKALKLGSGSSTASMTTNAIVADKNAALTIAVAYKAYSTSKAAKITITEGTNSQTYDVAANQGKTVQNINFSASKANPTITISTESFTGGDKRVILTAFTVSEGTLVTNYASEPNCCVRNINFDVQGGQTIAPEIAPCGLSKSIILPTAFKPNCNFIKWTMGGNDYQAGATYKMLADAVDDVTFTAVFSDPVAKVEISSEATASQVFPLGYTGDVVVKVTGKLTMDQSYSIHDFYIETTQGNSGQVVNAQNLTINGDAYMDYTLAVTGETAANQWHNFSVPFPVNALSGVYGYKNDAWVKLTNEVDYAIEDYHGDIRANGQYGWKKFRGVMQPGVTYSMTVNGDIDTFRFMKTAGTFTPEQSPQFSYTAYTGSGAETDKGWNGCGNMKFNYATVAGNNFGNKVQVLDATTYTYVTKASNEIVFTVGSAFFVQAKTTGTNGFADAVNASEKLYAPSRMAAENENTEMKVTLSNSDYTDNLYISTSEDALNQYEIGRDLNKMFATMTPKAPMLWTTNYKGTKLSCEYAPLADEEASYALSLYAPKAGEYTIAATQVEGYKLFLTQNGEVIWNLSMNDYTIDLTKGNTDTYGLVLKVDRKLPTDINNVRSAEDGVQKFIYDEKLIIIRDGKTYNAEGALME